MSVTAERALIASLVREAESDLRRVRSSRDIDIHDAVRLMSRAQGTEASVICGWIAGYLAALERR